MNEGLAPDIARLQSLVDAAGSAFAAEEWAECGRMIADLGRQLHQLPPGSDPVWRGWDNRSNRDAIARLIRSHAELRERCLQALTQVRREMSRLERTGRSSRPHPAFCLNRKA
jgi:hypothetical protein